MIRFGSSETPASTDVPSSTQRRQYQNSLAAMAASGIPTPIGFWSFNQVDTEAVTGGVGYDFIRPGTSGNGAMYTYIDGDIGVDAVYGGFWDRISMAEVNNAGVWRLDSPTSDMSASLFFRCNQYEGAAYTAEQGLIGYYNRSSATLAASTYPTYMLYMEPLQNGQGYQPTVGYYDSGGAQVTCSWVTAGAAPIGLRVAGWYHIGFTRTRNGVNDVDLELYVNGRSVATLTAQNDTGAPDSVNMRLIAGARLSSGDEFCGSMRDVTIWDEAISAADMLNMYNIGIGNV